MKTPIANRARKITGRTNAFRTERYDAMWFFQRRIRQLLVCTRWIKRCDSEYDAASVMKNYSLSYCLGACTSMRTFFPVVFSKSFSLLSASIRLCDDSHRQFFSLSLRTHYGKIKTFLFGRHEPLVVSFALVRCVPSDLCIRQRRTCIWFHNSLDVYFHRNCLRLETETTFLPFFKLLRAATIDSELPRANRSGYFAEAIKQNNISRHFVPSNIQYDVGTNNFCSELQTTFWCQRHQQQQLIFVHFCLLLDCFFEKWYLHWALMLQRIRTLSE